MYCKTVWTDNGFINWNYCFKKRVEKLNAAFMIEQFSNECRKTKTKVIALANQKGRRQSGKPIKTLSNYSYPIQRAGKSAHASQGWFWFHKFLIG